MSKTTSTDKYFLIKISKEISQEHNIIHKFYKDNSFTSRIPSIRFHIMFKHVIDGCHAISEGPMKRTSEKTSSKDLEIEIEWSLRIAKLAWLMITLDEERLMKLIKIPSNKYIKMKENPHLEGEFSLIVESIISEWKILQTFQWKRMIDKLSPRMICALEQWNSWVK